MAKTLQHRRGTTSELSSVTGAAGEIFYDTTKDTLVVMDGSTAGGYPLEKEGAGTGATGPQGAAGATGSQGPQGASGVSGGGGGSYTSLTEDVGTTTLTVNPVYTFAAGDILIDTDIITPLVLDSYGQVDPTTVGTLTVNGNLEVIGNIALAGNISPFVQSFGSFNAEVNKKYIVRANQSNTSQEIIITLPSATAAIGDVIEFFLAPDSNLANIKFDSGVYNGFESGFRYFDSSGVWYKYEIIRTLPVSGAAATWIVVQTASANINGSYTHS